MAPGPSHYPYNEKIYMMIPADEAVFLDTNVLVYANVASAPLHAEALRSVMHYWENGNPLWVSRQVLREFIAVLTRPQTFSVAHESAVATSRARFFEEMFHVADDTSSISANLFRLVEDLSVRGKEVHDTNIVATMLANHIGHLLTHNVADFQRFGQLINVIPLRTATNPNAT